MKKIMTRIAACSLAVLIAFNTVAIPKSKAVIAETATATSVLAAYLAATGMSLMVVEGGAAAASAGAASLISGYAAATGGTYSVVTTALASGVTIGTGGAIIIGAAAAALLAGIVAWLIDEYDLRVGGEPHVETYVSEDGFPPLPAEFGDGYPYWIILPYSGHDGYRLVLAPSSSSFAFDTGKSGTACHIYMNDAGIIYYLDNGQWDYSYSWQRQEYVTYDSEYYANFDVYHNGAIYRPAVEYPLAEKSVSVALPPNYEAPPAVEEQYSMVIDTGMTFEDEQAFIDSILAGVAAGTLDLTYDIEEIENRDTVVPGEVTDTQAGILSWLKTIARRVSSLPQSIAEAVKSVFVPDVALTTEITDTFSEKFAFVPQLHALGTDLLNMGPDSGPPVVYIHLEDAEGTIDYGGTVKALDMSWYERYKEDGDRIIGGFLWLGFLWALFMRVSDIINGAGMAYVLGQPTIYTPEPPHDAPRLEGSRKRGKR